jgi:hypothetical protein
MPEPLHVELFAAAVEQRSAGFEAGLQRGRDELEVGEPAGAGERRYDAELRVRRQEDGTVRYSGAFAHGTATDPFLYLSYRRSGEPTWQRRTKVTLPLQLDADVRTLRVHVTDVGGTRARIEEPGWEQLTGG